MAVVFDVLLLDLDKTLVDVESHVDYCAAVADLRASLPDRPVPETPRTGWGRCAVEAMQALVALAGSPTWQQASDVIERHELAGTGQSTSMPGLAKFLGAAGDRPAAIVTLLPERTTQMVLGKHGIEVDVIVPRSASLRPKPHSDQLEDALRLLGARQEQAVMIGDSSWDEAAARAAGVDFVGITNGREPHEFRRDTAVVSGLSELAQQLEGSL